MYSSYKTLICTHNDITRMECRIHCNWHHTTIYAVVSVVQWMTSSIPKSILPVLLIGVFEKDQRQLAIYSVLYSIWWLFAMGSMGFANAITVRVGYLLGANQPYWTSLLHNLLWFCVIS